jgi:hypothetical protein
VKTLKRDTPLGFDTLKKAAMLGVEEPLRWEWSAEGLVLYMPPGRPSDEAVVIKLS